MTVLGANTQRIGVPFTSDARRCCKRCKRRERGEYEPRWKINRQQEIRRARRNTRV